MLIRLRRWTDRLIGLSAVLGALALVAEVVVILTDVTGRALGKPLYGSQDLITMIMVLLVFGGIALCDRRDGHIVVDVFERFFPPSMNRAVDTVAAILGAVIFVFIAVTVWESAKLSEMLNLSTNLLRLPKAYFQWALSLLALLTAFSMALRACELITGRTAPVSREPVA